MTGMVRRYTILSSPATGSAEWPPDDKLRRVTTIEYVFAFPRRIAPEFCK